MRRLACAGALACVVSSCAAHAGGATHAAGKPTPGVERRCVEADASGPVPLRIVAVDESGRPLPHASVAVADAGTAGSVGALLETDERGEAEAGVLPGLWRVEVSRPGYSPERYLLDLRSGRSCSLRFELRPAPNEFEF